jgi:hypothetical protein
MNATGKPPIQNFVTLGKAGIVMNSPGLAVVKNAGSPRNWNVLQGFGFSGASLVYAGAGIAPFDVDIFLNFGSAAQRTAQWVAWEAFASVMLEKPKPGSPAPFPSFTLSIAHPILNAKPWEIERCVVEDVTSWEQNDQGLWSLTIKFKEYRKPKPVLTKPLEGPPPVAGAAPAPVDPAEKMIAELNAKNAALRGQL